MKFVLIIMLIISFVGCSKEQTRKNHPPEENNIVIIFGKRSYQKDTLFINNKKSYSLKKVSSLTYTKDFPYENIEISIDNLYKSDTLVLSDVNQIFFNHRYHYYYTSSYLFHKGDTVRFDYINDAPYCKVTNRNRVGEDLNFEVNFNLSNKVYENNIEFYDNNGRFRTDKENKSYLNKLIKNRVKQLTKLDSTYEKTLFDKELYSLLKNKIYYKINILTEHSLIKDKNIDFKNDSLLTISSYRHFLTNYCHLKFKTPIIKKGYLKFPDYRITFDSITNSSFLSKKTKTFLLYSNLKEIANNFSISDFKNYFEKFENTITDTLLINQLREKYMVDLIPLKKSAQEVYLINRKKEQYTLKDIIENNKGKLIYIDFWASWCAPCREVMPFSKKLSLDYSSEDIVFIYLSIDKDFDKWIKASKEEGLLYNRNSYFAINYPKANFYKELSLSSIPRYLLYDQNGNLMHKNSPGPKGNELKTIIDKYIKK